MKVLTGSGFTRLMYFLWTATFLPQLSQPYRSFEQPFTILNEGNGKGNGITCVDSHFLVRWFIHTFIRINLSQRQRRFVSKLIPYKWRLQVRWRDTFCWSSKLFYSGLRRDIAAVATICRINTATDIGTRASFMCQTAQMPSCRQQNWLRALQVLNWAVVYELFNYYRYLC